MQAGEVALEFGVVSVEESAGGEHEAVGGLLPGLVGEPVEPGAWTGLLGETTTTTATIPDAALWHALGRAAEQRQLGLTVLLALLALGENGAGGADPLIVTRTIEALRSIGLEREARGLALEAVSGMGS